MGRVNKKKGNNRAAKLKRRLARDIDQIRDDWSDPNVADKLRFEREVDVEEPGLNQFYCLECDRKFISEAVLREHEKTKAHKRRRKLLGKEKSYTQREAEFAVGKGPPDNGIDKRMDE